MSAWGRWRRAVGIAGIGAACLMGAGGCEQGSGRPMAQVAPPGGVPTPTPPVRPFFALGGPMERDDAVPPPIAVGKAVDEARAAWDLVTVQWRKALVSGDPLEIRALLHDQFWGELPGETGSLRADPWSQLRVAGQDPIREVKVLAPRIEYIGGPLNQLTLQFIEQIETEGGCTLAERRVDTRTDPGQPMRLWRDEVLTSSPCASAPRAELVAFHEALRETLGGPNPEEARMDVASLVVWDYGLKVDEVDVAKLLEGRGGWVRERILASRAEEDTTTVLGEMGLVGLDGGGSLLYMKTTGRWQLAGVLRGF